jgi:DNA-binding winged helix-turn-helix (wHTH) protein/tetratricopeptide (TPR) repeat protein
MRYRWDGFSLDHEAMLLVHDGRQVDVSRKTLDCIQHLVVNRNRVVSYDELIRTIWGHDNVTNHQLSQVILSARRAVGDDGQSQRLIRTAPGLGYRWVGTISEGDEPSPAPAPSIETAQAAVPSIPDAGPDEGTASALAAESQTAEAPVISAQTADRPPVPTWRKHGPQWVGGIAVAVLVLSGAAIYGTMRATSSAPEASPAATPPTDPLTELEAALQAGKYEDVREGLAALSPAMSNSQRGKLLEVHLDLSRDRTQLALQKLEQQQLHANAAQDPLWQARISIMRSRIYFRDGRPPQEVRAAAQSALDLLASMGDVAPPRDVSTAVEIRGIAFALEQRSDEAILDFVKARDIRLSIDDKQGAAMVRGNLARTFALTGQLREALDELHAVLDANRQSNNLVGQAYTLNTIAQLDIELLRWEAARSANQEALKLMRQVPDSVLRQNVLKNRAFILSEEGRLHEAAAHLEEAEQSEGDDRSTASSSRVMHDIASGNAHDAMARLMDGFGATQKSHNAIGMLEEPESRLLLWTLAARDMAADGKPIPDLPAAEKKVILNPKTPTGHIARGRWRWMQGDPRSAEADFRRALQETRSMGHFYRMTLAGEALIELLLKRGDTDGARIVLESLRAHQPTNADRDYRTSVMGLRVALALEDPAQIRTASARVRALAGERALHGDVARWYADAAR